MIVQYFRKILLCVNVFVLKMPLKTDLELILSDYYFWLLPSSAQWEVLHSIMPCFFVFDKGVYLILWIQPRPTRVHHVQDAGITQNHWVAAGFNPVLVIPIGTNFGFSLTLAQSDRSVFLIPWLRLRRQEKLHKLHI